MRFLPLLVSLLLGASAQAANLRWAAQNDILTFDPHSQNHATTLTMTMHVYEGLTRYDRNYNVEPALATGWQPDKQIVFTVNKNWWGRHDGNVRDFTYTPIKADATRVSALLSGDVDMVTDLPTQDVERLRRNDKLKVIDGPEVRTIFIGLDQHNDELLFSSVKGRNPFKDVRVRRALNMAVDREAIKRVTMRGLSIPAGL